MDGLYYGLWASISVMSYTGYGQCLMGLELGLWFGVLVMGLHVLCVADCGNGFWIPETTQERQIRRTRHGLISPTRKRERMNQSIW